VAETGGIPTKNKRNLGKAYYCPECNREMVYQTRESQKIPERLGDSLRGHTKKYRMILKKELAEIEEVEEENILTPTLLSRKYFIQTELSRLLEEEELYWHKRSNENWLLKGDNNADYFHKKANGKKRKNTIFQLEKEGEIIDKKEDILQHATEYYKSLFGPSESPMFSLDPNC
jgi:hypothetical protein